MPMEPPAPRRSATAPARPPATHHALLWNGTAASAVDLNPAGYTSSFAYGASGTTQVGYGYGTTGNNNHALLWNGTAASAVDLNPAGYTYSLAYGASGTKQVGYGDSTATGNNDHALLWSGTAASFVDLNPAGYTSSAALGASGTTQVGYGFGTATGNNTHALLWNGTAASAVDLNPAGYTCSLAQAASGTMQVGYGGGTATGNNRHALLWSGTAASFVDLNAFLPAGFNTQSQALASTAPAICGQRSGRRRPACLPVAHCRRPGAVAVRRLRHRSARSRRTDPPCPPPHVHSVVSEPRLRVNEVTCRLGFLTA